MQARMKHPVMVLPDAMNALMALNAAVDGELPPRTHKLVHLRASQINGCSVCVDMHARELRESGVPLEHIFAVSAWRETPFFDDHERVALELTEVLTRQADKGEVVSDALWKQVIRHFDEKQTAALLLSIAQINVWNRLNAAVRVVVGAKWEKAA
jgi:AhpD family alkylhydroperoxidase